MKTITTLMVLAIACTQMTLKAQYVYPANSFREKNPNPLRHRFDIYLGWKNHLQIDLTSMKLLPELAHADSILRTALKDIATAAAADSVAPATDSKKIEFLIDTAGFKTMRVNYINMGKSYAFDKEGLALFKIAQDTVIINKLYKPFSSHAPKAAFEEWQLTLVVNDLEDYHAYSKQMLDSTISQIAASYKKSSGWTEKNDQQIAINALYTAGQATPAPPLYYPDKLQYNLSLWGEVTVQNINQNLLASFVYPGLEIYYTRNFIKTKWILEPETFFFFERASNVKVSIYPNTFINLSFSRKATNDAKKFTGWLGLFSEVSLGMLVNRKSDYFEKNTFKLKLGGVKYKTLSVCLQFFFHDFFKQVQPSLRVGLAF